jgi:hypothetical protein
MPEERLAGASSLGWQGSQQHGALLRAQHGQELRLLIPGHGWAREA